MRYSQIILWLGLIMITVQIVKDWGQIKGTLFQGGSSTTGATAGLPAIVPFPLGIFGEQPPTETSPGETTPPENPPPVEPPPDVVLASQRTKTLCRSE